MHTVKRGQLLQIKERDGRHPYAIGTKVHVGDVANGGGVALVYVVGGNASGWVSAACLGEIEGEGS
jgi:hypothetical protein